ncbi:MAG: glycosyltransferase family 39 protein, partial [Nitrospira sp.]|nr:glycosyltransferase family 39 protein [Nitrospira sp.]
MENYNTSSEKRGIILLVILSVIYVTMCMSLYQHERVTGDASIFFDIAEKYSAGDYKNAVNGFWGPLLSWILVPFVHFKIDKFFTMNLLSAVIGVFTLIGIRRLSFRFKMSDIARSAALLCALPITLQASLIETQDFLLLCLLIYYLSYMLKSDYELRVSNAIYAGAIGAFAYFCKSYAFPFFVSHFIAANILHYFRATPSDGKRKVIRNV